MSPHSQLLLAAAAVGGVIVLTVGMLLGGPYPGQNSRQDTDPTLARIAVEPSANIVSDE